jgi:hypothetical protein
MRLLNMLISAFQSGSGSSFFDGAGWSRQWLPDLLGRTGLLIQSRRSKRIDVMRPTFDTGLHAFPEVLFKPDDLIIDEKRLGG